MFQSEDIKWVKNIKRDKGADWAYLEYKAGESFYLHFSKNPKWYPTNYAKPKQGELIVLFQTLNATKQWKGGWYVTHLITPIDNEIIEDNSNSAYPYKRLFYILATTEPPYHINDTVWSFFKCNRGQICNINTIEKRQNTDATRQQKQQFIWDLFNKKTTDTFETIKFITTDNVEADEEYIEGEAKVALRKHKYYERNPAVIKKAKEIAKREDRFFCEVCNFDFAKKYPQIGNDFIECHHKTPIATGIIRATKPEDLSLVCSNCHRMLHRKNQDSNYYSVEELRKLIQQNNNE